MSSVNTLTVFQEYELVEEKAVNLIYARERRRETNAMDIGSVGDELCMEDEGAVNKDTKCYRCGGYGHVAMNWATPKEDGKGSKGSGQKKGKGLDNGQRKGAWGDGKGFGYKVAGKDGRPTCSCCGKVGHGPHKCWTKHPEQLPWKRTSATVWECLEEEHGRSTGARTPEPLPSAGGRRRPGQ